MKKMFAAAVLALAFQLAFAGGLPVYLDKTRSPQERAEDLLGRLTLEEKASLMVYESHAIERLGIPEYTWWNEALHGVARAGFATVYPMPVAMAASFDAPFVEEVFCSVSDEGRIKNRITNAQKNWSIYTGITFWTPNINIFRDPRWGRGIETYGEDPFLTATMGNAVVRGLQGDPEAEILKAHACAKHLAVHSGPEGVRHEFNSEVSERDLFETYLPAFKSLVQEGGVSEVMFAYNSFRGVPCGANTYLLQDILREEWGFDGLIVSDCASVDDFFSPGGHHYCAGPVEAAAATVNAGCNLECGNVLLNIPEAVAMGLLTEEKVNENLLPTLVARFRLGEFDGVSPYDDLPDDLLCCEEHRLQALKMAHETMTLLTNDGTLPLAADASVALVGPNACDSTMMWGNYNGIPQRTVTLLDALKARIPDLKYVKGCELVSDTITPERVEEVLRAVGDCEYVVFAGGISPRVEGEELPIDIPGFYKGDRMDLSIPQVQRELIAALDKVGKKVILVNFSGSAVSLVDEEKTCRAILQAWYPGQEGGTAIADVLFGDYNPAGRLPVTVYKSADDIPPFECYDMAGKTYRYFKGECEFPFGYGKSYTTFEYGRMRVRKAAGKVVVKVRNTGKMDGDEVVQLYVKANWDEEGPIKSLRGFKRVHIKAGKAVRVEIPLTAGTFDSWDEQTQRVRPMDGEFTLMVGPSSDDSVLVKKTVNIVTERL